MYMINLRTTLAFVYIASLLVFPGGSFGHAFPDHSDPRAGSTLSAPPVSVFIWFDSYIEPVFSRLTVQDASGKQVDLGNSRVDSSNSVLLEVGLPALSAGTYRVIWNVVARDGHRTTGDFTFTIK
jgi:copper resistance protein C